MKAEYSPEMRFPVVKENRHGIILITDKNVVFGGGAYDGAVNVSPVHDSNSIVRAYTVAAMRPRARSVLVIGMSMGAWSQVLAHMPAVEHVKIVEIDPGYVELLPRYPEVAGLLRNPKVEIVIDDGRRWLSRHPEEAFDVIVMNTTFHWRAHMTNLLSREFLELCRRHLRPGGLLFYNTTGSADAQKTALAVFPHVLRVMNFVAGSEAPVTVDKDTWRRVLTAFRIEGRPVFDLTDAFHRRRLDELVALADAEGKPGEERAFEDGESLAARTAGATVVTDDNMVCEWRPYRRFTRVRAWLGMASATLPR